MAITQDASTPAIATGTGTGNLVSASFTPPAGSLVIALVANQFGTTGPTVTVTSSEGGGTWTVKAQQAGATANFGMSHIAWRYYAASPGAITVTAAFTALTGGRFLAVLVLNGCSPTQTGASAVLQLAAAGTNASFPITTTTPNAQVYGLVNDQDSNPTMVAFNAATTLVGAVFSNGTDIAGTAAFKATAAVGTPGATTLGITLGASNKASGAMMEVLPAVPVPTSGDGGFPGSMFSPNAPWSVTGGPQIPGDTTAATPTPILYEFTGEGGTDAATVTTADTGSGRPPDAVTLGTGATAVYTAAGALTGARSVIFDVGSTSSASFFQWNLPASATALHFPGFWFRYPSTFGATASIFSLNVAGTPIVRVQASATDKVRVLDQAGNVVYTSTATMTPGQSYFIAGSFLALAAGSFSLKLYDQTATLIESVGPTAADFSGGAIDNVRYGSITNQTNTNWRPLTVDQFTYRNDRMPTPAPLQPAGPFTIGSSLVGGGQLVRGSTSATAWTQSPTDDAGLTDTVSKTVAPAPTDLAGLTDTVAFTRTAVTTDDAGLTDTTAFTRAPTVTDDAGLTDTTVVNPWHVLAQTDDAGLTDPVLKTVAPVVTDDAGLTDTVTKTVAPLITDDAGLTDTATVVKATFVAQTDDAGLSDSVAKTVAPTVTDPAGLTDTTAFTVAPLVTDPAGLTDTVAMTRTAPVTDDAGLTDTTVVNPWHVLTQTDDAGLTDTVASTRSAPVTDDAGLTDIPTVSAGHILAQTDDSGLTDTATVVKAAFVTPTDDVGLSDSVAFRVAPVVTDLAGLTDTTVFTRSLAPTDDAGLTDTTTVVKATFVNQTDDAGLTDTISKTVAPAITDDSGLTDTTVFTRRSTVTDDAGLTDIPTVGLVRTVTQTDDAGLSDTVSKTVAPIVTDPAGLTDTTTFLVAHGVTPTDDAGLTDTFTVASTRVYSFTDSAGLTDTFTTGSGIIPFTARILDSSLKVVTLRELGPVTVVYTEGGPVTVVSEDR